MISLLILTGIVQAQTENKIVSITDPINPGKATTYSGTYVYQGTRASTGAGPVQTRPYYKNGTYYLFADYYGGRNDFPNGFAWYITNNILSGDPSTWEYWGWDGTSGMDYPEECTWWADFSNNEVTIVITNAASGTAPTVSTMEASLVTTTSGTLQGNVIADGGATTSRGFVYSSTDATPTIGEPGVTQITKGTGTGTYSETVTSLTAGVTYYYQAYGINTYGITYGSVKSFTTPTTSSPNKQVSGITSPAGANGVYVWIGNYYGKPAWKHQTSDYWVYYSMYGMAIPSTYYWYIDSQLRNEHGAGDYLFQHTNAATCPSSGWTSGSGNGIGTGTPSVIDYPQIDFTNGSAYSPANPTGGTTNNPVGRFFLDADIAGSSLTAVTITVSGTRTNVANLKLWSSTDATFNSGSDTQLNSQSDGAAVTFSGFSSSISASGTYYFITADLASTASGTISLTIGSKDNLTYSGGASSTVFTNAPLTSGQITIIPAVQISVNDVSVNENAGPAVFTISLSQTHTSDITVNYATANNTATLADNDYTNTSGTATITASGLSTTVSVPVTPDTHYEQNETYYLNLSGNSYGTITDAQGVGTINNDDTQPLVTLNLTGSPLAENAGTATVTATLSNRSYQNVTVNLGFTGTATGGGTDYNAAASITINAGSLSNSTTLTGVNDALGEGDETVIVDITGVTNGTENGTQQVTAVIADDDIFITVNDVSVNENEGPAVFTISLSQVHTSDITVNYATANNTATLADNDYTNTSGTATITASELSTTVSVPVTPDTHYEQNETFYLNISGNSTGTITDAQGVGTINNDDTQPLVTLSLTGSPLAENAGTATVTATLSNQSYQNVTVNLGFTGSAENVTDYTRSGASITVNAGSITGSITLNCVDDIMDENDETVIVDITGVTNGTENGTQQVTASIADDDSEPAISVNDPSVTEGDGSTVNLNFTVSLSAVSGKTVTVDYTTSDGTATAGTDYTTLPMVTLTFNPGTTTQPIPVTVQGDLIDEENEILYLDLSNASHASIADPQGVGTINDNDPAPGLSIDDVPVTEGNSGSVNATFTVTLSTASERVVTVDYATANNTAISGSDYTTASNTLTFDKNVTTQTITVQVLGDLTDEDNETYYVNLSSAVNATLSDNQGLGTITDDDDPPMISGNSPSVLEGDAGTTNLTFMLSLSAVSEKTISVDYATSDGTATLADGDYAAVGTTTLTYTPGQTTKPVTVTVNGDLTNEPNETVHLNLSNPVYVTIPTPQATGTITNDDGPPVISINDVTVTEGNSGTLNMQFTVSLNKTSSSTITVNYSTANNTAAAGSDYAGVIPPVTLTFNPSQTSKTVDITIYGDMKDENNETFYVNLTDETNAIMGDNQGIGTINDNDAPPALSTSDITQAEGNSGSSNAVFTVTLSQASGKIITLDYATSNNTAAAGSDYTETHGTLTINPNLVTRTIQVPVTGDLLNEANETFYIDLSNPVNVTIADGRGKCTIMNDDNPPTISVIPDQVTLEDQSTSWIPFTVNDTDTDPALLTLRGTSGNTDLVPNTGIRFSGSGTDRSVKVTPVSNYSGIAEISVFVSDGASEARERFNVTVGSVNDAPHISGMPDLIFPEDSSAVMDLDTWVTDADNSPGELDWMVNILDTAAVPGGTPPDTLCQLIIAIDDTSHKAVFGALPNYFGIHEVLFTVADPDGGTDSDTLTITVSPVNDAPRFLVSLPPAALEQGGKYALPVTALYPLVEDVDNPDSTLSWSARNNEHFSPEVTDGLIRLTAPLDWSGTDTVTIVVSDEIFSDSQPLTVTVTRPEDIVPPAAPQNLSASAGEQAILLNWDPNPEPDMQFYFVYRTTDSTAIDETHRIARLDHPVHVFSDSTAEPDVLYFYAVTAADTGGNESGTSRFAEAEIKTTRIEKIGEVPAEFSLSQNYPNPFNPLTRIEFGIPVRTQVSLVVFDILGRKVADLLNEVKQPGVYAVEWDASRMESGMYFIRVQSPEFCTIRKCMLVK